MHDRSRSFRCGLCGPSPDDRQRPGMFPGISGVIAYDDRDITRSSVEATIDVASLITGVRKRDEHVLSDEMLDAARFPTMTFRSVSIDRIGDGEVRCTGT